MSILFFSMISDFFLWKIDCTFYLFNRGEMLPVFQKSLVYININSRKLAGPEGLNPALLNLLLILLLSH